MTPETIARLRISVTNSEPEIWRVVDVPLAASLKMLHDIVQAAMGWQDHHLWEFEAGERRYGLPDGDWPDEDLAAAANVKLGTLVDRGVRKLAYIYDMGDDWHHTITVEAVGPGQPDVKYPRYVDGDRRCPPEDVGGLPGFDHYLAALADPDHEDRAELLEAYGPYDPATIDELVTKRRVAAIAIRRAAGRAAYAKRRG